MYTSILLAEDAGSPEAGMTDGCESRDNVGSSACPESTLTAELPL